MALEVGRNARQESREIHNAVALVVVLDLTQHSVAPVVQGSPHSPCPVVVVKDWLG